MKRKTMKRSKRKTMKRKSMKRKSMKRKSMKRKSMKRSKRKTMKRSMKRKTRTRKTKKNKKKTGMFKGLQKLVSEGVPQVVQSISEGIPDAAAIREAKREFDRGRYGGLDAAQKKELENIHKYLMEKYEENYPEGKQLDGKQLLDKRLDKREIQNLRKRLNKEIGSKESSEVYVAGIEGNVRKLHGDQLYKAIPPVEESRLKPKIRLVNKKKNLPWPAHLRNLPERGTAQPAENILPEKPEPYQKANSANSNEWEMSLG